MTQEIAQTNLEKWFWEFKHKMVDDFPEYQVTFEYIVNNSYENSLLYEVMEFAYRHLEVDSELKGGWDNLIITDYLNAIEYGYMEWIK
jgi:hypothetical protein